MPHRVQLFLIHKEYRAKSMQYLVHSECRIMRSVDISFIANIVQKLYNILLLYFLYCDIL